MHNKDEKKEMPIVTTTQNIFKNGIGEEKKRPKFVAFVFIKFDNRSWTTSGRRWKTDVTKHQIEFAEFTSN